MKRKEGEKKKTKPHIKPPGGRKGECEGKEDEDKERNNPKIRRRTGKHKSGHRPGRKRDKEEEEEK